MKPQPQKDMIMSIFVFIVHRLLLFVLFQVKSLKLLLFSTDFTVIQARETQYLLDHFCELVLYLFILSL